MRSLKDLLVRARLCAGCHVGRGDDDVTHDMIAAGHPPLRFEYRIFLANLVKHWDAVRERKGRPDFEAQAWLAGQIASTLAALRLLEQRAQRSKSWPEFAEYNCSACHHDLTNAKWRQEDAYLGKRRPGGLRWQDWYPETVRTLARQASGGRLRVMDRAVSDLQQLIDKPDTEPEWIARNARRVADDLERALPDLKNVVQTRESIANLFHGLSVANRGSNVIRSWEQAAQRYLALAALHDALNEMGQPDPHRAELLDAWERKLRLPRDYGSPRGFDPRTLQRR